MFQKLVRATVLCSILAVGVNAHAQFTYNWNNAGGGSYHTAGNWSPGGGPPILLDHAIFNLGSTYDVTFSNIGTQSSTFQVRNGNVTFNFLGPATFHNWNSTGTSFIGPNSADPQTTATLNLANMGSNPMRGGNLIVGHAPGKVGTLNLTSNGRWLGFNNTSVTIGQGGTGNLNITTAGTLQNSSLEATNINIGQNFGAVGGTGNATVSGINASMTANNKLTVGNGNGSLGSVLINAAGNVNALGGLTVGLGSTLNNTVTVDGSGSQLNVSNDLDVGGFQGKGTLQILNGGKVNSSGFMLFGGNTDSNGALTVTGAGSQFLSTNSNTMVVGASGTGSVNVNSGGNVTVAKILVDQTSGGTSGVILNNGTMNLTGSSENVLGLTGNGLLSLGNNSTLTSSTNLLIGSGGKGTLSVLGGSQLTSASGSIGMGVAGSKATISGVGSKWTTTSGIDAGWSNGGEIVLQDQGQITSNGGKLGVVAGGSGTATVSGSGTNWNNSNAGLNYFNVGHNGTGVLTINTGGSMTSDYASVGANLGSIGNATITNSGSKWTVNGLLLVGNAGTGNLTVSGGGQLAANSPASVKLGNDAGSSGKLIVTGSGSNAVFAAGSLLAVGENGGGILEVASGGNISGGNAFIGRFNGSSGSATVKNAGSSWAAGNSMVVGQNGSGYLKVENGGAVSAQNIDIASGLNSTGNITLSGTNSTLTATQAMKVGGGVAEGGEGGLWINNGTTATVGGALTLYSFGHVGLNGGTLQIGSLNDQNGDFGWSSGTVRFSTNTVLNNALLDKLVGAGHMIGTGKSLEGTATTTLIVGPTNFTVSGGKVAGNSFTNIGVTSVEAGRVDMTGVLLNDVQGTFVIQNTGLTTFTSGVTNNGTFLMTGPATRSIGGTFSNNGTLAGTGSLRHTLQNNATMQIGTFDRLVVENGSNLSVNNGTIQLGGGRLEFTGKLTNAPGSFISGNGTLATSSGTPGSLGLNNRGSIVFTSGANHVFGDVMNESGGLFVTSGGATTTFHDDMLHNGTEIRTSGDSRSVFLGSVAGAGSFTGTGGVYFEGDLRPGNSPASVGFDGDVFFSSTAGLGIELGGLLAGTEYDQLAIDGLVSLDGLLGVHTIDGFSPEVGNQFTIIDNFGSEMITGRFIGLSEGSQFWSGGNSYQISYVGGDGNDVVLSALFSVPEPGCAILFPLAAIGLILRRNRRQA